MIKTTEIKAGSKIAKLLKKKNFKNKKEAKAL
jgi:hypothetical protein